jgi:20S proteasome alpha/beta subunit
VVWLKQRADVDGRSGLAIQMPDEQSQLPRLSLVSGTLNLVLTNKNGFVIAADSRGTWWDEGVRHQSDDFPKLFRTGRKSAIAIAGLLATPPEPYRFESSSTILARFGANGMPDERGNSYFVLPWIQHHFGVRLRTLAAVLSTYMQTPRGYGLVATIGGYDTNGTPQLTQIKFEPEARPSLVNGKCIWMMKLAEVKPRIVGTFAFHTSGQVRVADAILAGKYAQKKTVFVPYLKALSEGTTGELELGEMVTLAKAIFDETMKEEETVGGEIQMGVIPSNGDAEWILKPVAQQNILLGGAELVIGGAKSSLGEIERPAYYELAQNFDTLNISRLFVATTFRDLTIPLDENHFFGCTFERCTLVYRANQKSAFEWNSTTDCHLEILNDTEESVPRSVRQLQFDCLPADENARKRPELTKSVWMLHR